MRLCHMMIPQLSGGNFARNSFKWVACILGNLFFYTNLFRKGEKRVCYFWKFFIK